MSEDTSNPRKRRGLGVVTPNACTECRKKRAKCDGREPCGRCQQNKTECIYELPVRQTKEEMRTEIENLRRHQQQSERILDALATGEHQELLLAHLQNREPIESIFQRLENAGPTARPNAPPGEFEAPTIPPNAPSHPASYYSWNWPQRLKGDSGESSESGSQERMDWAPESRPPSRSKLRYPTPGTYTAQPTRQQSPGTAARPMNSELGRQMILNPGFGASRAGVNYSGSGLQCARMGTW